MITVIHRNQNEDYHNAGGLRNFISTARANIQKNKAKKLSIKQQDAATRNDAIKALSVPSPSINTPATTTSSKGKGGGGGGSKATNGKSNTMLYVGIGVGVVVLGVGIYFLVKKKKK